MFWYQNVRKGVLSKNLLYDTLSPLSILKNPRWRPRWPPYIFYLLLTLCMIYKKHIFYKNHRHLPFYLTVLYLHHHLHNKI